MSKSRPIMITKPGEFALADQAPLLTVAGYTQGESSDYRNAQTLLWGDAGAWAYDTFVELNGEHFADEVPMRGIAWGLTPHGHALGHCQDTGRITLHPALLDPHSDAWKSAQYLGERYARDVLLHEMIHGLLFARGVEHEHNSRPWCHQVMRLAPKLGLGDVLAAPVVPRRVNGKVARVPLDGHVSRDDLARFPHTLRDAAWYTPERRIPIRL